MTTGEDRNKDRLKIWKLCGLWKLPLHHHGAIKLTQNCICFTQSVCQSLCSDFRHSWIPPQGTWTSPPAAVNFRSRAESTAWGVLRNTIPPPFSTDLRSCLIARSRKAIKCVLALLRRFTHAVPIRQQNADGSSCSSQQWHPRRVCDCLSQLCPTCGPHVAQSKVLCGPV